MGVKRIARAQLSLPERSEIDFVQLLPLLSQQEEGYIHYGEAIYNPEKRTRVSTPLAALQYAIAYHKGVVAKYRSCMFHLIYIRAILHASLQVDMSCRKRQCIVIFNSINKSQ